MAYDNPQTTVYRFPAANIATSGTVGQFIGPSGKKGRVTDIGYVITTNTTVAPTLISIGISGNTSKFATNSVPVGVANTVGNGVTDIADIDADVAVLVTTDGGCTAGAADLLVMIEWY